MYRSIGAEARRMDAVSEPRPHLKTLEEIEGVRYALWDMAGWHRNYDPCV